MNTTSKHFVIVLVLLTSFFACSPEDNNIIEHSTGTKLISIEFKMEAKHRENWSYNYYYSNDGKLKEVHSSRGGSLRRNYEIEYDEHDRIKQYSTYDLNENKVIFRDSIVYNSNGTIQAIHLFSINSGKDLPLTFIYKYEYDTNNRVIKKSTYYASTQEHLSSEKYYWAKDNIERAEHYGSPKGGAFIKAGELKYEYFYKYDDKVNFKKKNDPNYISDPINWSTNNVIELNWNDYLGNIELPCRPCKYEYKYNLDNHPVLVKYYWSTLKLTYE